MIIQTIDIDAVALMLGVSRSTCRRMWYSGQIPKPIRLGRRSIRWRVCDITQFIASQPAASQPTAKEPV